MDEWIKSPVVIPAVIAVVSILVTIGIWIGRVNSDRGEFQGVHEGGPGRHPGAPG